MKIGAPVSLVLLVLTLSVVGSAQETKQKTERYSGVRIMPISAARKSSEIDIRFNRYSSDAEAQELAQVLVSGGEDALRKALENRQPIGSITQSKSVSQFEFKLIRSLTTPEGRRIIAVSDRPIQFLDASNHGRTVDYNVGVLILDLKKDKNGKEVGEGTLIYEADLNITDRVVEVEHITIEPIRVLNVRKN